MKISTHITGRSLVRPGLIKKNMWIKSRADGVAGKQGKYRRYTGYICIEEIIMMEIRGEGSTCDSRREIKGVANRVELVVHQL